MSPCYFLHILNTNGQKIWLIVQFRKWVIFCEFMSSGFYCHLHSLAILYLIVHNGQQHILLGYWALWEEKTGNGKMMTECRWHFFIMIHYILIMLMTVIENALLNLHVSLSTAFLTLQKIHDVRFLQTFLLIRNTHVLMFV